MQFLYLQIIADKHIRNIFLNLPIYSHYLTQSLTPASKMRKHGWKYENTSGREAGELETEFA